MSEISFLGDDEELRIPATVSDHALLVAPADFTRVSSWELKPEGLCRGDVCVPARSRPDLIADGQVDLAVAADLLGLPAVVDAEAGVVALGTPAPDREAAMRSLDAPDFTLPDTDGNPASLSDHSGRKRVLVAWASWCGCRYDLPVWQQLHEELESEGLTIIAVSLDDSLDAAKPWVDEAEATYPVLVDRDQVVAERYGMVNVPTTVWIDENDRVVRPASITPGDDQFREFTLIDSQLHHDALRRWVRDDEVPMDEAEVHERQMVPDHDVQRARLERRVAASLARRGDRDGAERHFARAFELAPLDFTIRRGSMPLRGEDPFGPEFFDFWQEWEAAGRPSYGS